MALSQHCRLAGSCAPSARCPHTASAAASPAGHPPPAALHDSTSCTGHRERACQTWQRTQRRACRLWRATWTMSSPKTSCHRMGLGVQGQVCQQQGLRLVQCMLCGHAAATGLTRPGMQPWHRPANERDVAFLPTEYWRACAGKLTQFQANDGSLLEQSGPGTQASPYHQASQLTASLPLQECAPTLARRC